MHPAASRGRRALDEQAYAAAAQALEAATQARPREVAYWVDLGRAYVGQGRADDAVAAFLRARTLEPREARLAIYLGHAYELGRKYDLAQAAYVEAVALAPERAWPHRVLGTRLLRWGRPAEAVGPLRKAIGLDPSHAETHHALSIALSQMGNTAEARRVLQAALERFPRQRSLLLGLAALRINEAQYDDALGLYARVLEEEPAFAPAHVGRALLLAQLGRHAEAEVALRRAIQLDPRNVRYKAQLQRTPDATAE